MEKKRLQIIRVISVTLFFLLLNAVGIKKTLAQSFSMDGLSYTVNSDSVSVTLNGLAQGVTASGSLDIPEMVSYEGTGYSVTIIGEYAFYNKSGFTGRLTIPATITSIGTYAFYNCSGFVEVHFNATNCSDTYDSPFHNCGGTLVIGDNVIRIPAQMFYNSGFTGNLIIPDAVTSIGDYAFEDCSGFTGILTIPNAVSNIGRGAFSGCSGFSGVVYNAINCENASYNNPPFQGCGGSLVIGDNVERIPSYMFRNCSGFSGSLTIGNSVTFIGENAFSYCSGFIGSLSIPNSVTTIGYSAFSNCTGFTGNLTIGDSVTTIGHYAFSNCSGFTGSLSLGESVTTIGVNAFSNCSGFTGNLTIPSSVTTIGSYAFNNCSNFTEIQYNPKNCTVETDALHPSNINPVFPGCLGTLIIGNNVESIGGGMFKDGEFSEVIFNATNCADVSASIGNYPFTNCSSTLTIGDNVERIPAYMFTDCSGFTGSLTIPESVTSIGVIAFRNCTGITEVFFNAINCADVSAYNGNYPFKNCGGTLTIGNNVERIPAYIFSNCEGFTGNLIIPNSVISIGNYAFYNCNGFEENLTIGNSVTTIGAYAFAGCNGISEVLYNAVNCADVNNSPFSNFIGELTIGENVERIPANMFKNCNGFTGGLTIPNSVTTIGNYAFSGCSGFSGNLTIGNFVTLIGSDAFSDCNGFTGCLTIPNSISSIGYSAFRNCSGFSGVVFNATNCADYNYYSNSPFQGCSGTLAIGENVERIPTYIFYNCNGFTGCLTISASVTTIGDYAFYGCSGFNGDLTLPASMTTVGRCAFSACSGFNGELTIPASVTTIDRSAFSNCSGFTEVHFNATNCADLSHYYDCPFSNCVGTLTIGDNVERIPIYMFHGCNGFTSIISFAETPPSAYYAFNNLNFDIPVTVPCGTINAYQNTSGWNQFTNYQQNCTLETNLSDNICQGNDYLLNGFEIIQPEAGESEYSITLPSSQGTDSIVNLTLTVHPAYFFAEDTTLCNTTSFEWHGHTYTESGIYYDTLQTTHGCDSVFQLSLELFDTPLGEFASMTPTNNYPFTSLPIIFSWDAVSEAEYYNLYLWNVNDPEPDAPVSSNIYNRSFYIPSLQNHQTYNWYVEAINTCFSSTSGVRSFSLSMPPSMNISTNSLAFGEVVLNDSVSMNMFVSGNALDDAITLQITGEDASMFSFEQGSNWNGLTGGSLTVTFSPTAVQYNYTANLVITTGTLTQTVQLTGSLADMFVFNTYVTQDVFEMNSTIPIYGTVTDVNNSPMAGAEVEVKVTVMNMTRSLFATTGDDGHFSVDFVPANSESGYYTINSGRVGHNSTTVHDDFNIPGMNLVTNGWILWDVVQNEITTGSIVIRNRSQIALTDLQVAATDLPEGCSFSFQPLSLQGMEEGLLEYSVSGSVATSGSNYQEVRLVATSAEGATMNFSAWYYCSEPRGILYASPNSITTTMTKGISKIVDVMLYNNGTGPTGSVSIDLPSEDWLSVVGSDTLASIAVHDSAYFSLRLSANDDTPLVQYTGNIAVNCERGDGLLLPFTITAVSDSTGTLVVDVTDDYTYNGNGQHLAGATVTVKGYYSLQTMTIGLTGSDGLFTVTDIPEGYYRMSITAPRHAEYQAVILIEGGQTNTQDIYLQYQAITYSWNVVPTEIEDEYTFELIVEYETNVPVPVVVIDMPQTFPELAEGESFVFDYIITNLGLVDAYDATLYPPTNHPLYDFTPLVTEIDTLHAQTSVVIPCTMTVRTGQRSPLVYAALNGRGDRDGDCPDMAKTEVWSYYYCNGEKVYVKGYKYVQIGTHPCSTPPSHGGGGGSGPGGGGGGGGGGGHYSGSGGSGTPPVTTQQQGCNDDPCQTDALDELNSCPPQFDNTPKLPLVQPGNIR